MGVPWRVASRRILLRHVRAELARDNRFPGWGNLFRFWLWSARYYHNRNQPGLNDYGTPNTIATLGEALMQFEDRVLCCAAAAALPASVAVAARATRRRNQGFS